MAQNKEPHGFSWSYRDFLYTFAAIAFALLFLLNNQQKTSSINIDPQAQIVVTIHWDDASDSDVDLWVKSPTDSTPVGYSHMGDKNCNLRRDDLGHHVDPLSDNKENTACKRYVQGEWSVGVMMYNSYDGQYPVWVDVHIYEIKDGKSIELIPSKRVYFEHNSQFITVWGFTLDDQGNLVPGSVNDALHNLYSAEHPDAPASVGSFSGSYGDSSERRYH